MYIVSQHSPVHTPWQCWWSLTSSWSMMDSVHSTLMCCVVKCSVVQWSAVKKLFRDTGILAATWALPVSPAHDPADMASSAHWSVHTYHCTLHLLQFKLSRVEELYPMDHYVVTVILGEWGGANNWADWCCCSKHFTAELCLSPWLEAIPSMKIQMCTAR